MTTLHASWRALLVGAACLAAGAAFAEIRNNSVGLNSQTSWPISRPGNFLIQNDGPPRTGHNGDLLLLSSGFFIRVERYENGLAIETGKDTDVIIGNYYIDGVNLCFTVIGGMRNGKAVESWSAGGYKKIADSKWCEEQAIYDNGKTRFLDHGGWGALKIVQLGSDDEIRREKERLQFDARLAVIKNALDAAAAKKIADENDRKAALERARRQSEEALSTLNSSLRQAIAYALTGNVSGSFRIIDAKNCVFARGEESEDHEIFYLNNIEPKYIKIGKDYRGVAKVQISGTSNVRKLVLLPHVDLSRNLNRSGGVTEEKKYEIGYYEVDVDRLVAAWAYIYRNGCTGAVGPF